MSGPDPVQVGKIDIRHDGSDVHEIRALLSNLIKIPSVNSGSSPENQQDDAERLFEISEFVCTWLKDRGVSAKIVNFAKNCPTVIADSGRGKKTLLLNGHMDVVPAGNLANWNSDPFGGMISRGKVFGRGSADMKGGLAVMMHAMVKLADQIDYKLMLAAVTDEETGGHRGSKRVSERYKSYLVLIGEPTSNTIELGEKGVLEIRITTHGKTAHASRPSLGKNAILSMTNKLAALSKITETSSQVPKDLRKLIWDSKSVFGDEISRITFNPGRIIGGVKTNVVPDLCVADVDLRLPLEISTDRAYARVQELVGKDCVKIIDSAEPNYTDPNDAYASMFAASVAKQRCNSKLVISPGASDGRYFRERGIPTIVYGPGNMKVVHSYNECVAISELTAVCDVYCDFMSMFP